MLRIGHWVLLFSSLLCCNVIYAYTINVTVYPNLTSIAIGSSKTFTVTGTYEGFATRQSEETPENCRWYYSGASIYSDESCSNVSTIARATTATDQNWHRMKNYQKVVTITTSTSGVCWIKFRMKYRFTNRNNDYGTEVESNPVKVYVVGINRVEYSIIGGTNFNTTTSRVYIKKGTKVIFKAIPEPTDAT
jgi:hypothetical protein